MKLTILVMVLSAACSSSSDDKVSCDNAAYASAGFQYDEFKNGCAPECVEPESSDSAAAMCRAPNPASADGTDGSCAYVTSSDGRKGCCFWDELGDQTIVFVECRAGTIEGN